MAPKTMKRPASAAAAGRAAKRPAVAAGVAKKPAAAGAAAKANGMMKTCALVSKAVSNAAGYTPEALSMLCTTLPQCLGMPKEERHDFQVRIAEMIGEVLGSSEAQLQAELATADESFSVAQGEKALKEREEAESIAAVEEKLKAEEAAEVALRDSKAPLDAAREALEKARVEQRTGDAQFEEAEGKLAALRETKAHSYDALKEGTTTQVKASIQALLKLGKEFCFDVSLLNALPCALSKAPADRSVFDGLVLSQTDTEFQRCVEHLEKTIASGDTGKGERAAKVAAASSEAEKAKEAEQACRDSLKIAKAEKKAAEIVRKAAKQAAQALGPELKRASAELERANAGLGDFRTGPLAAFQELVQRSAELPPAPPAVEGDVAPAAEGDAAPGEAPEERVAPEGETAAAA